MQLHLMDFVYWDALSRPFFVRGYILAYDASHAEKDALRWVELKQRQLEDSITYGHSLLRCVDREGLDEAEFRDCIDGAEEIRMVLAEHDACASGDIPVGVIPEYHLEAMSVISSLIQ